MRKPALRHPIAVSLGAIAGALSRYYLGHWLTEVTQINDFPIGTFGVNLLGCFLMGIVVALPLADQPFTTELRLMVATGFLGSLTTFSSYELDKANLLATDSWWPTAIYWLGSPLLGWICLWMGMYLIRKSLTVADSPRR